MVSWGDLWRSPPLDGEEASERMQTAHTLLRAGTVLMAVALVVSIAIDPLPPSRHVAYGAMLVVHVLALLLVRRGALATAVITFATLYLVAVFAVMWKSGGVRRPPGSSCRRSCCSSG